LDTEKHLITTYDVRATATHDAVFLAFYHKQSTIVPVIFYGDKLL
jgi:hypothetical protein